MRQYGQLGYFYWEPYILTQVYVYVVFSRDSLAYAQRFCCFDKRGTLTKETPLGLDITPIALWSLLLPPHPQTSLTGPILLE